MKAPRSASSQRAARRAAGLLAGLRCAIGAIAFVSPGLPAAPWVGKEEGGRPGARLFARTLGGRDLALGLGLLVSMAEGAPISRFAQAGALADAGDFVATLLAFERLPRRWRYVILAVTAGAALSGAFVAPFLDGTVPAPGEGPSAG